MTISAEEIAKWIKRRVDQGQPLISLSPSMACDVVASLTDMKTEIEKRDARIAALEAQLAAAVTNEREQCAKIAERDVDWASFGMTHATRSNPEIFESKPNERNVTVYRSGICAGRSIAAAIRARSEQERMKEEK